MPESKTTRSRSAIFLAVLGVCLVVAIASVTLSVVGGGASAPGGTAAPAADTKARSHPVPETGVVVFRTLDRNHPERYGHIAWAPVDSPESEPRVSGLGCERVHFAAGRGICLSRSGNLGTGLTARLLGPDLQTLHEVGLSGAPSRARISPDGRHATVTAFVTGHSYADSGAFSTQTSLIDVGERQGRRRSRGLRRHPGWRALRVDRLQLLGRDLRA